MNTDLWDKKRQLIWIAGGLIIGTFVAYSDSFTDDNEFSWRFFIFMEGLVLLIMAGLFYWYSRRQNKG
ncbi:MAG TPA: hypothetical protein VFD62_00280 [Pyrinomonadaceae bacterium]|nr:hypothetical protein [Pyrinomonadaceae bacterium]